VGQLVTDALLAIIALLLAGAFTFACAILRARRRARAIRETAIALKRADDHIQQQRKTYLQDETARRDAKHLFLAAHLNAQIEKRNRIADALRREVRR
jgi:hypothetical protein